MSRKLEVKGQLNRQILLKSEDLDLKRLLSAKSSEKILSSFDLIRSTRRFRHPGHFLNELKERGKSPEWSRQDRSQSRLNR